ncbi:MAG: hypothetical protein KJ955_00620 [Nanoarchaeota archaeon]|nr:hypothetical protein [Nanoarchaeota archaeon]
MVLLEMKLKKVLGSKTAALDEAVANLDLSSVHRKHAAERMKANDLKGAERAFMLEALLIAEAHLNIGIYHSVYGLPEKAREHLNTARSVFIEQKDHGIAKQITRYMSALGL